jgi:23S rRNA (guanine745-N1)-methyltransferase
VSLALAAGRLLCPVCRSALDLWSPSGHRIDRPEPVPVERAACAQGHSFDPAASGYLNLSGRAAPANADSPAMVRARHRFLASGAYDRLAQAVADHLTQALAEPPDPAAADRPVRALAEAGVGTGHYLQRCLEAQTAPTLALAWDVSPAAARQAARNHPGMALLVADTWRPLPLRPAQFDGLLCLFAPRHLLQFADLLAPGGVLLLGLPEPDHLASLRRRLNLIGLRPDKLNRLLAQLPDRLTVVDSSRLAYDLAASPEQVSDLVMMGPNAFHGAVAAAPAAELEVRVRLLTLRRTS